MSDDIDAQARAILAQVKPLALAFYHLTGRPLGVTGEMAEYVVAEKLDLKLVPARTPGYDALRGEEKIQIKGAVESPSRNPGKRMGRIKIDSEFDAVILVVLKLETLEPIGMWEASRAQVVEMLSRSKSKARTRGQLAISEFKRAATQIWAPTR
ncbi:MAG: hypothetical protein ABSC22_17195 [Roseiarcus sp.]|jgi:hypothetical protein